MKDFKPDITQMVSPFLLIFIIHATQLGEGILSFERQIAEVAGYDSWMSIPITAVLTSIVIVMIWKIIGDESVDLIDIHQTTFGKIIGNILSFTFCVYFLAISIIVIRSYIEIIQIWFFPDISITLFLIVLFLLFLYICLGGFRIVVGFAFFSIFVTAFLAIFKYQAFIDGHFTNLLPVFIHPLTDILKAVEPMSFSFLGIELILIYAPFIHRFQSGLKWALSGNLLTSFVYLFSAIAIFMYYNELQIQYVSWPTLHLWKVISIAFIERFEFIGISLHFIAIIATCAIYFWAGVQCFHRLTNLSFSGIGIAATILGISSVFYIKNFLIIEKATTLISKVGVYLMFVYIPLLFIIHKIVAGVRKKYAKS
ncbi:spore germination protein [Gracilibacillus caseinilyticus]|uniref:Spore germination protein n=1 Tax=Gracilibacillus caseinilyticus TaxID=2932256 RepID=A0ABY4EUV7_9BACI|nr:GerAB/ArcD/ProY family transporter [Gracilibacillus caseinilyticus]UOQ48186.1 spore germination protein [Gracilibacillus caseinilyticus]